MKETEKVVKAEKAEKKLEALKQQFMAVSSDKKKMIESTLVQIDKAFGKGSIMFLQDKAKADEHVDAISTGSILLDQAVGVGGFPRGRIIEVFGPESSGKTTISLHAIAQAQKAGGVCAFIDAEHALDPAYAANVGININDLIISQPDFGEQALDIAEMLIRSGAVDLIVIDSVAALVPKAELEGEMGDAHVGLQARLMSQALRKLTPVIHKSKTVLLFINQIRSKINAMPYGNNETTTGGNALKFYASLRLDVRRIATIKKGDRAVGNRVSIKVAKNKVAPPFKKVELDLLYGVGISQYNDLFDAALECKVFDQSGTWISFNGNQIAQGREKCVKKLAEDKTFYAAVRTIVMEKYAAGIELVDSLSMTQGSESE